DGIRDDLVTGVQTCALPICDHATSFLRVGQINGYATASSPTGVMGSPVMTMKAFAIGVLCPILSSAKASGSCSRRLSISAITRRSEERRVGRGRDYARSCGR